MVADDVVITDYDPEWPSRYEREGALIYAVLGDAIAYMEHIGSTAVPGLAAKPVIDIQLGVRHMPLDEDFISALEKLGYEFRRYYGPWWAFFRKGMPRTHHLHVVNISDEAGLDAWDQAVLFRDYLRAHPGGAGRYEALRRELAEKFRSDRLSYGDQKTDFIFSIIEKTGREPS